MNELFPSETVQKESPRLEWLKRNRISTHFSQMLQSWSCWSGDYREAEEDGLIAQGKTEEDSIYGWAIKSYTPLWNEQQFVREKRNL